MKKLILIICLIFSFNSITKSQLVIALLFGDKLYTPKTELGLNVGANASSLTNIKNAAYINQVGFGMYFKWKLNDNWQLQPEFYFRYPQGGKKLPPYGISDSAIDSILENSRLIRKSQYFSLPIHINYRIWDELRFSFGPQFSFMTSNEDVFNFDLETGEEVFIRKKGKDQLNTFDIGCSAGLSYTLRNGKGVTLAARGYLGFINPDGNMQESMNYNLNFYVGIPIGVGKEKVDELSTDN